MKGVFEIAKDLYEIEEVKNFFNFVLLLSAALYSLIIFSIIRDTVSRFDNQYIGFIIGSIVGIFFPLLLFPYILLRPHESERGEFGIESSDLELALARKKLCWDCKSHVREDSNFCSECGATLTLHCVNCNHYVSLYDNYCFFCGTERSKFQEISSFQGVDIEAPTYLDEMKEGKEKDEVPQLTSGRRHNLESYKISPNRKGRVTRRGTYSTEKTADDSFMPITRSAISHVYSKTRDIFSSLYTWISEQKKRERRIKEGGRKKKPSKK